MRVVFSALAVFVLPALILSACGEASEPAAPDAPAPTLAGVTLTEPLRILGTEPFWAMEITADQLVYSGVDRPEQTAANPGAQVLGATAVITTRTDQDQPLVVTLIATDCSDGMSDRLYPLTARVEIGGETLKGCAASVAALERAGESGRVE